MKRTDAGLLLSSLSIYLVLLFSFKPSAFQYRFDHQLLERYHRSQDIPHEVKNRVFLSDSEIHIAAGYLYATGANPTEYNFQHPPLIKYLFGFTTLLTSNPHIVQMLLGALLISLTFIFTKHVYRSSVVAWIASLFLAADPLMLDLSSQALLDLGQAVLLLLYAYVVLSTKEKPGIQGILLGLLVGAKFWAAALFMVIVLQLYRLYKKQFRLPSFLFQLLAAFITVCLIYIQAFVDMHGVFNIVFFQLKLLKYWLHHSVTSMPGASFIMFMTGYFKTWWGRGDVERTNIWTAFWPLTIIVTTYSAAIKAWQHNISVPFVIEAIPLLYVLYLGVQAPFPRYFILILPFLYMGFSHALVKRWSLEGIQKLDLK